MASSRPAGASRPYQASAEYLPPPASANVATSGSSDDRLGDATASAVSLPLLICGSTEPSVANELSSWPPTKSVTTGAAPL